MVILYKLNFPAYLTKGLFPIYFSVSEGVQVNQKSLTILLLVTRSAARKCWKQANVETNPSCPNMLFLQFCFRVREWQGYLQFTQNGMKRRIYFSSQNDWNSWNLAEFTWNREKNYRQTIQWNLSVVVLNGMSPANSLPSPLAIAGSQPMRINADKRWSFSQFLQNW